MIECVVRSNHEIMIRQGDTCIGSIDGDSEMISRLVSSLMKLQKKIIFCYDSQKLRSYLPYYHFDSIEMKLSLYPSGQFLLRDMTLFLNGLDSDFRAAVDKMKQGQFS